MEIMILSSCMYVLITYNNLKASHLRYKQDKNIYVHKKNSLMLEH